jgi:transcriptional regulator with XRE-family HTH domain
MLHRVSASRYEIEAAGRRARADVDHILDDARHARLARGISMTRIAGALGCSRQLIGLVEHRRLQSIDPSFLARYCAAVGLDLSVRAFPGGAPLRDVGQLRLLARLSGLLADGWTWRTEVPVTAHPADRRAIDAVLTRSGQRVGIEAVARIGDAQATARMIALKQEAVGLRRMILLLADTRHNRAAVVAGEATLRPAFPLRTRAVLGALRAGLPPASNGIVFL